MRNKLPSASELIRCLGAYLQDEGTTMKRRRGTHTISIGWKMITASVITTACVLSLIVFYLYGYMRKNAISRFETEMKYNTERSGDSIDHYISSTIRAMKSAYINHELLEYLLHFHSLEEVEEHEKLIEDYFRSVYYASTTADQIYLAIPKSNLSILYRPRELLLTYRRLNDMSGLPELKHFSEIQIDPTHFEGDYGHSQNITINRNKVGHVLTLWMPIANLPATSTPEAYLAADIPLSFIQEQCKPVFSNADEAFIVDETGSILSASDESLIGSNFMSIHPEFSEVGREVSTLVFGDRIYGHSYIDSPYYHWRLIKITPASAVYAFSAGQQVAVFGSINLGLVVLAFTYISIILHYTLPLRKITEYMEEIAERRQWHDEGNLKESPAFDSNDEIGSLYRTFAILMESLRENVIQQYELNLANARLELRTMQAQINPHFIYNVIQCFATNALRDNNLSQYRLISSFGQMLHYCMVLEPSLVPLKREVEYISRYIDLQDMRFDQKLDTFFEIEEQAGEILFPKMAIQPLVENTVMHGLLYKKEDGQILIRAKAEGDVLEVLVKDNGKAVSERTQKQIEQKFASIDRQLKKGGSKACEKELAEINTTAASILEDENHNHFIGLENVYSRLVLSFETCEMTVEPNDWGGTSVRCRVTGWKQAEEETFT